MEVLRNASGEKLRDVRGGEGVQGVPLSSLPFVGEVEVNTQRACSGAEWGLPRVDNSGGDLGLGVLLKSGAGRHAVGAQWDFARAGEDPGEGLVSGSCEAGVRAGTALAGGSLVLPDRRPMWRRPGALPAMRRSVAVGHVCAGLNVEPDSSSKVGPGPGGNSPS